MGKEGIGNGDMYTSKGRREVEQCEGVQHLLYKARSMPLLNHIVFSTLKTRQNTTYHRAVLSWLSQVFGNTVLHRN